MRQDLQFGVSLTPVDDVVRNRMFAQAAEEDGLDLIGIQDHPYVANYLDTFVLAGDLLAATKKITVFPDVANLPLRPPALLAKTAAALDSSPAGRFELALGAGGYWDAITRLGVLRWTLREANVALEEAIAVMRSLWAEGGVPVRFEGEFHSVSGVHPGPAPAHLIEIWTGLQGPKALARTGGRRRSPPTCRMSIGPRPTASATRRPRPPAGSAVGPQDRPGRRHRHHTPGCARITQGAHPVRGTAKQ